MIEISSQEFDGLRNWLYQLAGIHLQESKRALVSARLTKRLVALQCSNLHDYMGLLRRSPDEVQAALNLLTTNETSFFREPEHFDFLRSVAQLEACPERPFRVWSAACSSGEEPYSIAMVLAEVLGDRPWEVVATDLSTRVLQMAKAGRYPEQKVVSIPKPALHRHFLKGIGVQAGQFLVAPELRRRVVFGHINLTVAPRSIGSFDFIFLRNVMIYFDLAAKRQVVANVTNQLRGGGYLLIGHSESLNGVADQLHVVRPSIYRRETE